MRSVTAQSTWKKSTASMLPAWVRRNCRQVVSVCRTGAGGMPVALQDPPDRRGADAVAECEQLALDPLVSPARVLPRHPLHQGGEHVVDWWPSGPGRVGPSSAHEAAMPAQDRVRGDQAMATHCAGQLPDEGGEHGPVRPVQAWSWVGAAQHGDLVTQHEELDVLGGGCAGHAVGAARAPHGRSSTSNVRHEALVRREALGVEGGGRPSRRVVAAARSKRSAA